MKPGVSDPLVGKHESPRLGDPSSADPVSPGAPPPPPAYLKTIEGITVLETYLDEVKDLERGIPAVRFPKHYRDRRLKKTVEVRAGNRTFLVKIFAPKRLLYTLKTLLFGSKAARELHNSRELLRRGLPIVPVAAVKDRNGERWVATEKLLDWSELRPILLDEGTAPARRRALLYEYGRFARRLQDGGVWQYDFNPTNVLVRDRELRLIDFERVRLKRGPVGARARLRLLASMNRIPKLSRTDRLRFLRGYVSAHPEEQAGMKSLAVELDRLTRLKTDHDDRKEERRCVEENRDFGSFSLGDAYGHYRKDRGVPGQPGLTLEQVKSLSESAANRPELRIVDAPGGIAAWQRANRAARHDGARPLAVILRRSGSGASLVFPPE